MGCSGSKQNAKAADQNPTLVKQKEAEQKPKMKALIVSTSAATMGDHATGAWSEEICGPYYVFQDGGCDVVVCSIEGGDVPIDAGSLSDQFKTANDTRMIEAGSKALKGTSALKDVVATDFDIVFFAGGHGTCVDFPTDAVGEVVSKTLAAGKVVAAVCHGPMALVNAKTAEGESVVKGKKVACFTNVEEEQVGLTAKVPFALETRLKDLGAAIELADPWADKAVQDGDLITGQNPQSSVSVAKLALARVAEKAQPAAAPAAAEAEAKAPEAETGAAPATDYAKGEAPVASDSVAVEPEVKLEENANPQSVCC
eukprot:TRINITY_DN29921_c0_g1_i1.p2 TRINITY_DN29921_c0_g1~~TRINITY_DN29921_c0_g1_i1.p2  ORF type:complete len:340 (+),score=101.44 TRINITY_DN29921_c0_g1_i1:83-1021(+)